MIKTRTNVHNLKYEIILATRYLAPIFTSAPRRDDITELLTLGATRTGFEIQNLTICPNYIHFFAFAAPKFAPSRLIQGLKSSTTRAWLKKYPEDKDLLYQKHLWSPSFYVASIGDVSVDAFKEFLASQRPSDLHLPKHVREFLAD